MKLLSWNLAGRKSKVLEQIDFMCSRAPDICAVQEVTPTTRGPLAKLLWARGFPCVLDSFALAPNPDDLVGPRRYGQLIASRFSLTPSMPSEFSVPWLERILSCIALIRGRPIELHTAHIPPGSTNGWVKVEMLEGIYAQLARPAARARILCGDFNTPDVEFTDGRVMIFSERLNSNGEIIPNRRKGQPLGR